MAGCVVFSSAGIALSQEPGVLTRGVAQQTLAPPAGTSVVVARSEAFPAWGAAPARLFSVAVPPDYGRVFLSTPTRSFFSPAVTNLPFSSSTGAAGVSIAPPAPRKPVANFELSVIAVPETLTTEGMERSFTAQAIESSTGTFGDISRFVQTLAGVVSDNDQRNDFLVRGGNPAENLFVIDNIEIPSINQLALSDTTGGLVSMLDNNAIQRFDFHDDAFASHYDQRLSSVVDISTRTYGHVEPHHEMEAGIAGVGGSLSQNFGSDGALFVSAREGVLQYLTNDIGMNGTPHYRNAFVRAENSLGAHDSWWGMSLFGIDSIAIHPSATDVDETNPFDIHYSGWRSATGVNWQHIFSAHAFGVASLAHTEQTQNIAENDQLQASTLVYSEQSRDSATTLKYDATLNPRRSLLFQLGGRSSVDQLSYNVDQPLGLLNPYSPDPTPLNADAFDIHRPALTSSVYADATWTLPHNIRLSGGERYTDWTLDGRSAATARASLSVPVFGHTAYIGYAEHAQLPPELFLLAFNNLNTLKPIRSRQVSGGVVALDRARIHLTLDAYDKRYSDYPVAANFQQLSLANIADTFGQAFLMFPMTAQGTGIARGVEATLNTQITRRLSLTSTGSYSRDWFTGQDGILRRGNYDIPAAGNFMARWSFGKDFVLSGRFNITTGRPYTPDNLPLSIAQNRDVYDLDLVNAMRAPSYQRLDFKLEQSRKIGNRLLTWHVGLENALNRQNFYANLWEPRLLTAVGPGSGTSFESQQNQMPRFPDAGIKITY